MNFSFFSFTGSGNVPQCGHCISMGPRVREILEQSPEPICNGMSEKQTSVTSAHREFQDYLLSQHHPTYPICYKGSENCDKFMKAYCRL